MHIAILIAASAALAVSATQSKAQDASPGTQVFTDPDGFEARETPGGYEPAKPMLPANIAPGTHIVFVPQALTPTEAYPPPPPRSYPLCNAKRRDNCRQR
ncbi:hypothetical protein [Sphingomonas sp. M1-B02]|uniref:hypothetical protein n=1 Tax=Sphingomonas sp. M1-B02 TaxID=3114300 RepID=UPI002240D029|nr:hypothetical protein [Sphingomonas sp. S6-11]UZK66297.1 hypothetical protein OKW87_00190 [Sphingomonas sp. S6-11]